MDDFHNEYFPPTTDQWNKGTDENYPMMNASVQPDRNWPEERYWDARIAAEGIRLMRELAEGQKEAGAEAGAEPQPWFLGIGFHQPHRPWHFPLKYWDLYDNVPIPTTPHLTMPKDAPSVASGDVNPHEISLLPDGKKRYWADPLTGGVGLDGIRENVRGYHASVSFLDNQVPCLALPCVDCGGDGDGGGACVSPQRIMHACQLTSPAPLQPQPQPPTSHHTTAEEDPGRAGET